MSKDSLDPTDRQLLNIIQQAFPVDTRPYKVLGDLTGVSAEEALDRVTRLRDEGVIRRLGGVFDSPKLGYVSTLCAVSVPEAFIDQAAALINPLKGVTHHYVRDHHYNLWFTLIAPSQEALSTTLQQLERQLMQEAGASPVLILPALETFKIKVNFQV